MLKIIWLIGQQENNWEYVWTTLSPVPGAGSVDSVQALSRVRLSATPWTAACQAPLSFAISQSLLKLMSIELVIPSNHLILCLPLLLLPSIFPSTRVFSNESVLRIRWPKYWSFSFSISSSNEYSGLISFTIDWLDSRYWTQVTHIAGRFFISWATREAQEYWSG